MNGVIRTLGALAAGAAAMYLMDPTAGRRRRALIRDKAVHISKVTERTVSNTARDLSNRSRGVVHGVSKTFRRYTTGDHTVAERVRSRIGRVVSNGGKIRVNVHKGIVTLRGPVLKREHQRLLRYVKRTTGVDNLRDMLDLRDTLQPVTRSVNAISGRALDAVQGDWTPTTRLIAGTAGGTLGVIGARGGGVIGFLGAIIGGALLARSIANKGVGGLIGHNGATNGVVRKAVESIIS